MNYEPDQRYDVTIEGARVQESKNGKLSFNLLLKSDHGTIFTDIWLSPAALERARKTLATFGYDSDAKIAALARENGAGLKGQTAKILTKEDEYNGVTRVKVAYIDGPLAKAKEIEPPSDDAIASVCAMFGGSVTEETDDEAVPF